jgi:hypothetical protein
MGHTQLDYCHFNLPREVFAVPFHFHGKKVTAEQKIIHILPLAFYEYFAEKKTCFRKLKLLQSSRIESCFQQKYISVA